MCVLCFIIDCHNTSKHFILVYKILGWLNARNRPENTLDLLREYFVLKYDRITHSN